MRTDSDAVARFFRDYAASAVGATPVQPGILDEEVMPAPMIERTVERPEDGWESITVSEQPARPGEFPERFIDGSQAGQPVLCVRSPEGWPIPMVLSEVGAVALRTDGRGFRREFVAVERVLSFVADPFPWYEVEAFASALLARPELHLRLLPANRPQEKHNPFDYEVMRNQARRRAGQEMTTLERLALAVDKSTASLVDGPLHSVMGNPKAGSPLFVGVTKTHSGNYLHEQGWRTLLTLGKSQRTPVFKLGGAPDSNLAVASWYLKLGGGPHIAPNWGYVRVEVPWTQFLERAPSVDFGFVNRLSRWLIDARCRADSYARMPVSLDPIVRAEEALKPLFTPIPVLVNRLYRTAGLFRGGEL